MFLFWHTLIVAAFVATAFVLGYKLGKKSIKKEIDIR